MSSTRSRPSLDNVYLRMVDIFAQRSTCARRQVAAIITDEAGHVLSIGYNGVPRGFAHCIEIPCNGALDQPGDTRNCLAVHAEQNALLQLKHGEANTIYCSCTPCFECAKLLTNTSIRRVVINEAYSDLRGKSVLMQAGVMIDEPGANLAVPDWNSDDVPF